ncbi:unnamed protein product [Vitrella brassicaformis CCMP3155]|uniref:Uncharacterized protein n=1 Tax=Vitrella brassicaformis (strain CCMP3155) TaxID=1169540 RepID=A0A0G4EG72_VITBC|nr:unnamed protein product [Vitrella brassicaformis CCMP3155]|eukprot:CEL94381.1 unnamed protein product [Vitrella brassicaformis CCMP3155]
MDVYISSGHYHSPSAHTVVRGIAAKDLSPLLAWLVPAANHMKAKFASNDRLLAGEVVETLLALPDLAVFVTEAHRRWADGTFTEDMRDMHAAGAVRAACAVLELHKSRPVSKGAGEGGASPTSGDGLGGGAGEQTSFTSPPSDSIDCGGGGGGGSPLSATESAAHPLQTYEAYRKRYAHLPVAATLSHHPKSSQTDQSESDMMLRDDSSPSPTSRRLRTSDVNASDKDHDADMHDDSDQLAKGSRRRPNTRRAAAKRKAGGKGANKGKHRSSPGFRPRVASISMGGDIQTTKPRLGEARRAALKTMISEAIRHDPLLREKIVAVNKLKFATVDQLFLMAEMCGLGDRAQEMQDEFLSENKMPKRPGMSKPFKLPPNKDGDDSP